MHLWQSFLALIHAFLSIFCDHLAEIDSEGRDALLSQLEGIEALFPHSGPPQTEWAHRKEVLEENWCAMRNEFYSTLLFAQSIPRTEISCSQCKQNAAVIQCSECRKLLCSECDDEEHIGFPFHDREVWLNGYFEPIGNCMAVINGEIQKRG